MGNVTNQNGSEIKLSDSPSTEDFTLIKGTFTPTEAKEVLMSLISSKISFHNIKNLRSYELNGKEDQDSKKKIKRLKKVRNKLLKVFENIDDSDVSVNMDSQVNIEFQVDAQ
ncbi:hypothetical protein [Fodinibius sp. SL11]|uniref:hypothetical protein n=1 Tax=Fodinibius sp. SL11 TaxID=3425690 RepID=UPI003F884FAA